MSQENVQTMREFLDAFNRRDIDALGALLDPGAEIVPMRAALESGVAYRGATAAADWVAAVEDTWEDLTGEFDVESEAEDRVLVLGRIRGRGRESGVTVDVEGAGVAEFRTGLITRLQIFTDREKALQAWGARV